MALAASANTELVAEIAITEDTQIDFGILTEEDGTCTMASGGGLTGSLGQSCTGSATPGSFTITGTNGKEVDLTLTAAVDGVTYNPLVDGDIAPRLTGGTTTVAVIGSLVLLSAGDGDKNISYTFAANYP